LKVHLLGNRHAEEEAPPHADEDEPAF
jgi:hypothetical protein